MRVVHQWRERSSVRSIGCGVGIKGIDQRHAARLPWGVGDDRTWEPRFGHGKVHGAVWAAVRTHNMVR